MTETGIIMILNCKKYASRRDILTNSYRKDCPLKSYFIVGDPMIDKDYILDSSTDSITVKCEDGYDWLPHKVKLGLTAIHALFNPEYIIKIDDDMIINNQALLHWINIEKPKGDYLGLMQDNPGDTGCFQPERFERPQNKLPVTIKAVKYCAGPCYYLSKKAYMCVIEHMDPEYLKLEDMNVGTTLNYSGNIFPILSSTYGFGNYFAHMYC